MLADNSAGDVVPLNVRFADTLNISQLEAHDTSADKSRHASGSNLC